MKTNLYNKGGQIIMTINIADMVMEAALDQMIEGAVEEFEEAEAYDRDMTDIIDFLNPTENEEE
ncbi:MAG: hypothetical protein M0P49_06175 [Bacilli bacterium]|nr:hypothetical protein [Bacilli bacterium]